MVSSVVLLSIGSAFMGSVPTAFSLEWMRQQPEGENRDSSLTQKVSRAALMALVGMLVCSVSSTAIMAAVTYSLGIVAKAELASIIGAVVGMALGHSYRFDLPSNPSVPQAASRASSAASGV